MPAPAPAERLYGHFGCLPVAAAAEKKPMPFPVRRARLGDRPVSYREETGLAEYFSGIFGAAGPIGDRESDEMNRALPRAQSPNRRVDRPAAEESESW